MQAVNIYTLIIELENASELMFPVERKQPRLDYFGIFSHAWTPDQFILKTKVKTIAYSYFIARTTTKS